MGAPPSSGPQRPRSNSAPRRDQLAEHLAGPRNPLGFYRWNSMWGEENQSRKPAEPQQATTLAPRVLPGPPKTPHPDVLPGPPRTPPPASPKASGIAEGARRCIKQADELRRTTNRVLHRTERAKQSAKSRLDAWREHNKRGEEFENLPWHKKLMN